MPFSSSLLRVSLVLVLLHGVFVSSALRAEPEEEKVAAAAAAPAAPSAECAKRFPRLSFGLKTLFFGMTLAAFLAYIHTLKTENAHLKSQLAQATNVLASQGNDSSGPQIKAWIAELQAMTPAARARALDDIYSIARNGPNGGGATLMMLTKGLPPQESVGAYRRAWLGESEPTKRYSLVHLGDFSVRLGALGADEFNRFFAEALAKTLAASGPEQQARLYELVVLLSYQSGRRRLSPENLAALTRLSPVIVAAAGPDAEDLRNRYLGTLAGSDSPPAIQESLRLIRKMWITDEQGGAWLAQKADHALSILASNPDAPLSDDAIELFIRSSRGSSSYFTIAPYLERHFIPAEKFAPYVHAGNAHGLLDGVLHELGRSRPQGEAPIDTRSYRQLAKAAIETLSKDKEKPFGEISGSIQVIAESEIKASGKDSADSLVFRKYLAESLASSLEFPGDGRYLPYFGASLNSVLARELDVPFSDAQWDRIAVAMYQRPGVMREVLGMPASGKGAPPEKLRPLVKRLVTQMETEMAALEKSDPGERAFRIVALARAARLDPAVLSREKVVEWAKTIPERTAESHYYIPQIISGVFFEEK